MSRILSSRVPAGLTGREPGQGMVEYALILALVSIAAVGVLVLFGPQLQAAYNLVLAFL